MRAIDGDALIANQFKNDISYKAFVNLVKRQPTIEPERKNGKWIDLDYTEAWLYKCDQCGKRSDFKDNYCSDCGADMKGDKE